MTSRVLADLRGVDRSAIAAGALPIRAGSTLLENSPFLPPNTSAGAAQEASPLELRSILRAGGDLSSAFTTPPRN